MQEDDFIIPAKLFEKQFKDKSTPCNYIKSATGRVAICYSARCVKCFGRWSYNCSIINGGIAFMYQRIGIKKN
jgi:hypothetical protein